ncbi:unnamed protein product, partial [Effrenium voratum]
PSQTNASELPRAFGQEMRPEQMDSSFLGPVLQMEVPQPKQKSAWRPVVLLSRKPSEPKHLPSPERGRQLSLGDLCEVHKGPGLPRGLVRQSRLSRFRSESPAGNQARVLMSEDVGPIFGLKESPK